MTLQELLILEWFAQRQKQQQAAQQQAPRAQGGGGSDVGQQVATRIGQAGIKKALPWARYETGLGPNPNNVPQTGSTLGALAGYGGGSTGGTLASGPVGGLLGNYLGVGTQTVATNAPVVGAEAATMFPGEAVPSAFATGAAEAPVLAAPEAAAASGTAGAGTSSLAFGAYAALPAIASIVGSQLQKSGSPTLQQTGRGLSAAGTPIPTNPFSKKNVANPSHELRGLGESLLEGGPVVSAILKGVGWDPFHGIPTQGTQFRQGFKKELGGLGVKLPDMSAYNIDPGKYNALPGAERTQAAALGKKLVGNYKHSPEAYGIQAQNLLLNNMSAADIASLAKRLGVG